jgi:imidazole glycerol-phosphate synthase subunit HisF
MLKKRLVGIVIVKDGWAVQSFGYNQYLPLGKPDCLVENLDRWGADEIFVLSIDRFKNNKGPDFELLDKIGHLGLETPLIYGGGIKSVEDGVEAIQLGADRICIDGLMHDDIDVVKSLSERLGVQALIGSFPLAIKNDSLQWLDYRSKKETSLSVSILSDFSKFVSEFLIIDWKNEGSINAFDKSLVDEFPLSDVPLIAFGGLTEKEQIIDVLSEPVIAAVAIGNVLNYKEHSIQSIKQGLKDMPIRLPDYESKYTLLNYE